MSSQRYQNKLNAEDQTLDELYARLTQLEQREDSTETALANNLTRSIKALSRKWLQEAYLDGMMLADNLHRLTSQTKNTQSLNTTEKSNTAESISDERRIALAVQKELQKLGLVKDEPKSSSTNSFANITVGLLFILGGFFIIGGAIGFYGFDKKIADYATSTLASLNGNSNNTSIVANDTTNNSNNLSAKVAKVSPIQTPTQTEAPNQNQAPTLALPNLAANAQNLNNPTTSLSNGISSNSSDSTPVQSNSIPSTTTETQDPNLNSSQNLPTSCNGQKPVLNRPLNIQNPNDRAVLYCILDLQSQNQTTSASPTTQENTPVPNPSQIPQR